MYVCMYVCMYVVKITPKVLIFFVLLYLMKICNGEYRPLLFGQMESLMNSNFITYALPCLGIGFFIKEYESTLLKFKYWGGVYLLFALCSYFVWWLNSYSVIPIYILCKPWFDLAMIITAFMWAVSHKSLGEDSSLSYIGAYLSGSIYYFHYPLLFLLDKYLPNAFNYSSWGFIYVLILSIILAFVIKKVQDYFSVNLF